MSEVAARDAADRKSALECFRSAHDMAEKPIADMDYARKELYDIFGIRYEEVETNIWGEWGKALRREILYLGTGRHGGGIILRPLYVRISEGCWVNSSTAAPAPFPASRTECW